MDPVRLDGIEPGALLGQQESQQAYISFSFGLPIVGTYPRLESLALMPTGMVPDHDHHALFLLTSDIQQSLHEGPRLLTIRLTVAEVKVDLIGSLSQSPKTSYCFLFLVPVRFALDQTQRLPMGSPCTGSGLGKAREPALILVKQQPVLVGRSLRS